MISDNGPEYASSIFKQFAKKWDFKHITTSPNYPQANGLVERNIQTIKRILKKAFKSNQDSYLAMLALRTTPLKDKSPAPAQKLMKRTLRTNLSNIMHNKIMKKCQVDKNVSKNKELETLKVNDTVRIRFQGNWKRKGRVIKKLEEPRSYLIETEEGN